MKEIIFIVLNAVLKRLFKRELHLFPYLQDIPLPRHLVYDYYIDKSMEIKIEYFCDKDVTDYKIEISYSQGSNITARVLYSEFHTTTATDNIIKLKIYLLNKKLESDNIEIKSIEWGGIPKTTKRLYTNIKCFKNGEEISARNISHSLKHAVFSETPSAYYNDIAYSESDPVVSTKNALDFLLRFVTPGKRILDIGCGKGYFLDAAKNKGYDVYGVDFRDDAVKISTEIAGKGRVLKADIERGLPLFPVGFDAINVSDVFEHVGNKSGIIDNIYRALNLHGILILRTMNYNSLMKFILGDDGWEGYSDPTHLKDHITVRGIDKILKDAGFKILYLETYGVWSQNNDPLIQIIPYLYNHVTLFRNIIEEKGLGDFINCVAEK